MSEGFIDALADLHSVDYEQLGLGGLGRPDGFVRRQITGWMDRWEKAKTGEVPLMNKLGAWFLENMPPAQPPVLLHNDLLPAQRNVRAGQLAARSSGVFDWEMSTLGDPMIDLGIALNYWREASDPAGTDRIERRLCAYGPAGLPDPRRNWPSAMRGAAAATSATSITIARGRCGRLRPWSSRSTCASCADRPLTRASSAMGTHPPVLARAAAEVVAPLGLHGSKLDYESDLSRVAAQRSICRRGMIMFSRSLYAKLTRCTFE